MTIQTGPITGPMPAVARTGDLALAASPAPTGAVAPAVVRGKGRTVMAATTGRSLRDIILASLDDAIEYRDGDPQDIALANDYRRALEKVRAASNEEIVAVLVAGVLIPAATEAGWLAGGAP
jgi:hypothetical protein